MKNQPRKLAMYLAQRIGDYRLTEIAKVFSLTHYGGVSNAINSIKQDISSDPQLQQSVDAIINRFDP